MEKEYFKCRDGSLYTKYTKKEISDLIDPFDFNTIRPFLKEMDIAAWEDWYYEHLDFYLKNKIISEPKKMIYRYMGFMKLAVPRQWGYNDWEERQNIVGMI